MNADTAKRLLEINFQFYQTFAQPFSETRRRLQPGVERILRDRSFGESILDLGCGNGEFWRRLNRSGYQGRYIGLDFSIELLRAAAVLDQSNLISQPGSNDELIKVLDLYQACFIETDLSDPSWEKLLGEWKFDVILAFATLHHLPGKALRSELLSIIYRRLARSGIFIFSVWQFLDDPRFVQRLQPWESVGLSEGSVDPGDYLLDWRHGGNGIRYVHHFHEDELAQLAEEHGFEVGEAFYSDGKSGRLSFYQVWEK